MNDPRTPQQSPSPFSAPIASPDGRVGQVPPVHAPGVIRGDYKTAPPIVKSARFLAIFTFCLGLFFVVMPFVMGEPLAEVLPMFLLGLFLAGMGGWLMVGHKRGQSAAWVGQIVMSALGLTGFPLGTLIHGYLLAKWFSPEVKTWYGQM